MSVDAKSFTSIVHLQVNGSDLSASQIQAVRTVVVEQSLNLPHMCTVELYDIGDPGGGQSAFFGLTDGSTFSIGSSLNVLMGREESPESVFKGEITGLDLDVGLGEHPKLVVRAYAKSHRLHRGRYARSFENVKDSDVASQLAGEAGVSADVDATSVVYDYLFQNNQTDWEFLRQRAERIGYELWVDDTTLHFRKPQPNQTSGPDQTIWDNLLSLRVKVSSAFQANQVTVRGWDPMAKEAIVGQASTAGNLAPSTGLKTGKATADSAFGSSTNVYVVNQPVTNQSEANALAQAVYDHLDGTFAQAEGLCKGDPDIKPGVTLDLKNVGTALSGKYYVTSATHTISSEGYTTSFVVSGRQSDSLLEMTESNGDNHWLPRVCVGIVTDNSDPDKKLGRVKVKLPWLYENDNSYWARVASPMAGNGRGIYFLPEVNDEVLVAFEHGDPTRAYVIGSLWNGQDAPPEGNDKAVQSSQVVHRIIKTRAGHTITLDDTEGSELISIVDKTGNNLIKIESSSNTITIQSDQDVKVVANKGDVSVTAQQNVKVTAQQGDVTVDATQGNVKVTAMQDANITVQGNAAVKATQNASVQGLNVDVKADVNASVQASAQLSVKGAVVSIQADGELSLNSSGIVSIQGSMVSIN